MAFGEPEWPPAPARVFQALIAGAAVGRRLSQEDITAFRWLEGLGAPLVGAPRSSQGEACTLYVPNNDLDSVGGDPSRVGDLKTKKLVIPRLLEGEEPVLYLWEFDASESEQARAILTASERLSHLGRGIDPAWAWGELLDE